MFKYNHIENLENISLDPVKLDNYELKKILGLIINQVKTNNLNIKNIESKNYNRDYHSTVKKENYSNYDLKENELKMDLLLKKYSVLESNLEKEKIERANEVDLLRKELNKFKNVDNIIKNELDKVKLEIEYNYKNNLENFINFVENNVDDNKNLVKILSEKIDNEELINFKLETENLYLKLKDEIDLNIYNINNNLKEIINNNDLINNNMNDLIEKNKILNDNDNDLLKKYNEWNRDINKLDININNNKELIEKNFSNTKINKKELNEKFNKKYENFDKKFENFEKKLKNNHIECNNYIDIMNKFDKKLNKINNIFLNKINDIELLISNNQLKINENLLNKVNKDNLEKLLLNKLDKSNLYIEFNSLLNNSPIINELNDRKENIFRIEEINNIKNDIFKLNNLINNKINKNIFDEFKRNFITIDQLNEFINQFNKEINLKANFTDIEEFLLEQNKINNFLCSENFICRYKWKNNNLLNNNIIPWEIQSINTLSENFIRKEGKIFINTTGLYEIKCGFNGSTDFIYSIFINNKSVYQNSNKEKYYINKYLHSIIYLFINSDSFIEIKITKNIDVKGFLQIKRL